MFVVTPSLTHSFLLFFFNDPAPTEIYTLSLHDALPISGTGGDASPRRAPRRPECDRDVRQPSRQERSEEHTSELQSHHDLVCRLLLEKKKKKKITNTNKTKKIRDRQYTTT